MSILEVSDLRTYFQTVQGVARAVDGVTFNLDKGETLAVVGESGCGKTVLANSLMRLFRHRNFSHPTGSMKYNGRDMLTMVDQEMQDIRGRHMAMIFQEPMAALNPVWKICDQIGEPLIKHLKRSRKDAYKRSLELLEALGVPGPDRVMTTYPHTLSGGMRQRVAIAMALACEPDILIADEPTTALDVTVQAQILSLMKDMQKKYGMALLIITHDLGIVNEIADRVMVMYSGRVIESGITKNVLFDPKHPYTQRLISAVPSIDRTRGPLEAIDGQVRAATGFAEGCRFAERCPHATGPCLENSPPTLMSVASREVACFLYDTTAGISAKTPQVRTGVDDVQNKIIGREILSTESIKTWFPVHTGIFMRHTGDVRAVDDVSFQLHQGETLAVVGESGCGKSTLGLSIIRLVKSTGGKAVFIGQSSQRDILQADRKELLELRQDLQIIFQDPFASLNPRFSVREIIEEGLVIHEPKMSDDERDVAIGDILEEVGLARETRFRYPHEFSGGQRQRVAIARALILRPKLLILDEATSALDVSIQAQVLNLLKGIQKKYGTAFIFITHNLGVVRYIADRVLVMYLGKVVESGTTSEIIENPRHPYTQKLVASVPRLISGAKLPAPLQGDVPSPITPPSGCHFHPRCPLYLGSLAVGELKGCKTIPPDLSTESNGRQVRCHHPLNP